MKRIVIAAQFLGTALLVGVVGLVSLPARQIRPTDTLSATELGGKKLFLQRCSVCHLPPLNVPQDPDPKPFGPLLNGSVRGMESETRAREIIRTGTPRMPGFQYGLEAEEIDALIAYLKTL